VCCFNNLTDVLKFNAIGGKSAVAPVFQLQHPDKIIMLVQMEIRGVSPYVFDEAKDRKALEIVSRIVTSILERIYVSSRTAETNERAYNILKTCKCTLIPCQSNRVLL